MASVLVSSPDLPCARSSSSSPSPSSRRNPPPNPRITIARTSRWKRLRRGRTPTEQRRISVRFALAGSESPKSLGEESLLPLFQELADSLDLPPDYLAKLPRDLRLDLNDAAFDLSKGPVLDECGQDLGEMLLNLAKSWEQADTSTSRNIASKLPLLQDSLNNNVKEAFGRRLVSAGRRFQSMGQYGEGELQRIANAMTKTGKVLSASPVTPIDREPKKETRVFKVIFSSFPFATCSSSQCLLMMSGCFYSTDWFHGTWNDLQIIVANFPNGDSHEEAGYCAAAHICVLLTISNPGLTLSVNLQFGELQVELTPEKANIGAALGFVFGILSWQLSQGIQSIPESSSQYANDNALLLGKSLRGALLALSYSSAVLSACASVGLVLLGRQLSSKSEDKSQDK